MDDSPGRQPGRFGGLGFLSRLLRRDSRPSAESPGTPSATATPASGPALPLPRTPTAGTAEARAAGAEAGRGFDGAVPDAEPVAISSRLEALASADPAVAQVVTRFRELAGSKGQIVVGPWLSEVGYEVLYWIPFLHWAVREFKIDPRRLTIVSRGGVADWYAGISRKYVDLFDIFTPDEFRELNEQRWKETSLQKHMTVSSFDRAVLQKLGFGSTRRMIHPQLMYKLFDPYWSGEAGFERFREFTKFKPLAKPKPDFLAELPPDYVAVKFYSRPSMLNDEKTAAFVNDFTRALAERHPVVFLNTQISADDHGEFAVPDHPNVHTIQRWLTPTNNLTVQSAIVANAQHVYCTYGGFAYLPLLYRVPVCGFYSTDKHFMKIHGRTAYMMANIMQTSLSVSDIAWLAELSMPGRREAEAAVPGRAAGSAALKVV